jgi:putative ABC transport system permease protein
MPAFLLFYRLIVRPLLHDRVRTILAILTVALGVAVVLAIELAGDAAAGSFRSSVESLSGREDFEVTAVGGVPADVVGRLARLPYPLRVTARVESIATVEGVRRAFTFLGIDLLSTAADLPPGQDVQRPREQSFGPDDDTVFVPASLQRRPGEAIRVLVNDRQATFLVAGLLPSAATDDLLVTDIATADRALGRSGRVDRILLRVPDTASLDEWEARLRPALGEGPLLSRRGAATAENRRMLSAFRWNLRVLSYVALIVGAFLIYNTISVSVVRRRPEIGAVRALGASRRAVMLAFLAEAAALGLAGALAGLPLGRLMASAAVGLIGATVNALYVSSTPGAIELTGRTVALALAIGIGLSILSALSPAREASQVSPVDAMGRGRRDFVIRVHRVRDLMLAIALGAAAAMVAQAPALGGIPVFGYVAAVLSVASCGLAIPALVNFLGTRSSRLLGRWLGVEALLASRSLAGSLRRTSVLVAALATAIAMTTSVGIMVGSFRTTVVVWLNSALPADLYLSPAGFGGTGRHLDPALADRIERLPGVAAVDRFRPFDIRYRGRPATLAFFDARVQARHGSLKFLSGRPSHDVVGALVGRDRVIVSEPFAYKQGVRAGDLVTLPLGAARVSLRVEDVYYDYSGERGFVMADRALLLRYLPDQAAPATLAVYVAAGADAEAVGRAVRDAAGERRVAVVSNAEIRRAAVTVFDRTFAITYALEAVSVFVAVMGIAGALVALVIDRRRELGLLRFLGASKSQVRRLVLFEAGLLGLLANVAGLALGVALSLLLVFVINKQSFGWTIQFHWPVAILLGGLTIVYAATVIAGIYPAVAATRLNPIEVVHEE